MTTIVARDLMTVDVLTVGDEMTLQELATFFRDRHVTGAPVRTEEGEVVGVVSLVDLARADAERADSIWDPTASDYYFGDLHPGVAEGGLKIFRLRDPKMRVRDIMNREIYAVEPDTPVAEIAGLMLRHHIHRLLVIDDDELVGLVSTSDLLRILAGDDVAVRFTGGTLHAEPEEVALAEDLDRAC